MIDIKRAELKVSGMVCAACTAAIEKSLRSVDGVQRAEVNLGTARIGKAVHAVVGAMLVNNRIFVFESHRGGHALAETGY